MKRRARASAPGPAPAPQCPACTTPTRCGTPALHTIKGPRCVGRADGPDDCDCLNACGDDPWLANGRARPCAAAVARQQAHQQLITELQAAADLVDVDLAALIAAHALPEAPSVIPASEPEARAAAQRYSRASAAIREAITRLERYAP